MGFTGELVRSVFSRNHRPFDSRESKVRNNNNNNNNNINNGVEKRRWVSVKSYLCGDELNSVLAEEDSTSVRSSEDTVWQPVQEEYSSEREEEIKSEETVENYENDNVTHNKTPNSSNSKFFNEEEAAILIQSAYRAFLCRRQNEGKRWKIGKEEEVKLVTKSPDRKSIGTSIEVQTGKSTQVFSAEEEKISVYHRAHQQRYKTQVIKQKEDWDDSTVSSYVSKMRMQNRMEATTKRERALAYAFSQQLRICSKRKSTKYNSTEPSMSWSWLERWMATRIPDTGSVESHATKEHDLHSSNQRLIGMRKRFLDVAREEKESCGSNEVPLHFDNYSETSQEVKDHDFRPKTIRNNLKAKRTVSRRKTVPSYQFPEEHSKVNKRDGWSNARKDNKQKENQTGSRREVKSNTPKASNE